MNFTKNYKAEAIAKLEGEIAQLREKQKAHQHDQKAVLRSPSTVYGGQVWDSNPDMPWSVA